MLKVTELKRDVISILVKILNVKQWESVVIPEAIRGTEEFFSGKLGMLNERRRLF